MNEARLQRAAEGYRVPRISHDSETRLEIKLSPEDQKKTGRRGVLAFEEQEEIIVTDLTTGKKYRWEVAPCSCPTCFCDAVITPVT